MIRPQAIAFMHKWREFVLGGLVLFFGFWLGSGFGVLRILGALVAIVGAALIFTGLRRALFAGETTAPGIVSIVEGQILYMGPVLGGAVDVSELTQITYRMTSGGEAFWRFTARDMQQPLIIPAGAQGADLLPDALVILPHFDPLKMVKAIRSRGPQTVVIWNRSQKPPLIQLSQG